MARIAMENLVSFVDTAAWSLTDCSSLLMREHGLDSILTRDHHFTQEGCSVLPDLAP